MPAIRQRVPSVNGVAVPYGESPPALEQHLQRSIPEASAACWALSFDPSNEALEVLIGATKAKDWALRRLAVESIGAHPLGTRAASTLRPLLGDASEYVVRTACEVLGLLGDAGSHDSIANLVRNRDASTRTVALSALQRVWRESDFPVVFEVMLRDLNMEVRRTAAWVLRHTASAATSHALFDVWKADPVAQHRVWACEVAARFLNPGIAHELKVLSEDTDGHVRRAASSALQLLAQST